jgi:hypothetical protein
VNPGEPQERAQTLVDTPHRGVVDVVLRAEMVQSGLARRIDLRHLERARHPGGGHAEPAGSRRSSARRGRQAELGSTPLVEARVDAGSNVEKRGDVRLGLDGTKRRSQPDRFSFPCFFA